MITTCIIVAALLISGDADNPDGTYRVEVEEYTQVDAILPPYDACKLKYEIRMPLLEEQYRARFVSGRFVIAEGSPVYVE